MSFFWSQRGQEVSFGCFASSSFVSANKKGLLSFLFCTPQTDFETGTPKAEAFTDKMGEKKYESKVPLVEDTEVRVLYESEASFGPDDKSDYPLAGANSIYSAILSRNEAVKDAKRLKTFLELRDKYVKKKVVFEDPLFPANDSSLFYSHKPSMKIEWKRPSVSTTLLSSYPFDQVTLDAKHMGGVLS